MFPILMEKSNMIGLVIALAACGPSHPDGTGSPCLAAYDADFRADELIGVWSVPPCEGETEATCQVRSVEVQGEQRCYLQPVPDFPTDGLPLLIVWHGSDSNGASYRGTMNTDIAGLELEAAVGEEAVVVYPDGRTHSDCGGTSCWDRDPEGPDVAFFDALIAQAEDELGVDPSAVYSVGHSRGGRFTEVLGCHRAGAHAAIAMLSAGDDNVDSCPGQVPAWLSHGVDDQTIPFDEGVSHVESWAERNGCDPVDAHALPTDACTALAGCEHAVSWCPTTGAEWDGHAPPQIADEELWAFLRSQPG